MADRTPRVCTSAGHGKGSRVAGKVDPGAAFINTPGDEADIVLAMAKNLDADYAVLFDRLTGAYHMLRAGGYFAKADDEAYAHACDIFNELHTDAAKPTYKPDGKTLGCTVLYEDPKDAVYAHKMANAVATAANVRNRGAQRRTDLAVLTPHPGMKQVIIEMVFGTDADDVAHYKAHIEDIEVAILNVNLEQWGMRQIKSGVPPRKWSAARRAFYRANRFA